MRRVVALLALASAACSGTGFLSHPDPEASDNPRPDEKVKLPPFPKTSDLIAFEVGRTQNFDFFVDAKSLSVDQDRVIRFTVVAKSSGVMNISYEGIRCPARERKIYAYGRPDGTWREATDPDWVRISRDRSDEYRFTLYQDFFCPGRYPIGTADEGIAALRRGGHPKAEEIHPGTMTY